MGDPMDHPAPADVEAVADVLLDEIDRLTDVYEAEKEEHGHSDNVARTSLTIYLEKENGSQVLAALVAAAVQRLHESRATARKGDTEPPTPVILRAVDQTAGPVAG